MHRWKVYTTQQEAVKNFAKLSQKQRDDAFHPVNLNRSAANNKRARIQSILDDEDRKHIAAGKPDPFHLKGLCLPMKRTASSMTVAYLKVFQKDGT